MSWRSPPLLPLPLDPSSVTWPVDPKSRLVLGAAWRLRAFAHALAHGIRRVPSPEHAAVAGRMAACLTASDAFAAALRDVASDGDDPERLVQARLVLEPLPRAESWAEVVIADALFGSALDAACGALAASSDEAIARAARVDRGASFGGATLDVLAADPPNRECLQLLVERWATSCVEVFGRPGTEHDAALVATRVKPRSSGDALLAWLEAVERRIEPWGLALPDAQLMGVVVPAGWTPRRRARASR